jgi:hypothetical protein
MLTNGQVRDCGDISCEMRRYELESGFTPTTGQSPPRPVSSSPVSSSVYQSSAESALDDALDDALLDDALDEQELEYDERRPVIAS